MAASTTISTIDKHAVNRAKLVERLAAVAQERGITPEALTFATVRALLVEAIGRRSDNIISDTTWACLVIRLGGNI